MLFTTPLTCCGFCGNTNLTSLDAIVRHYTNLEPDKDAEISHGVHAYLSNTVYLLERAGLIEGDVYAGEFAISPSCNAFLQTLGIRLGEVAHRKDNSVTVSPLFPRVAMPDRRNDVFVLMPFATDLTPVYDDHLKAVCESLNLSIARADDVFSTTEVMNDVWQGLLYSRVIVADCTGRNPNVFYELGIAHTLGKPVVLLTQQADDIPFDIRHLRYIAYDFTPRGMKQLETALKSTLQRVIAEEVENVPPAFR